MSYSTVISACEELLAGLTADSQLDLPVLYIQQADDEDGFELPQDMTMDGVKVGKLAFGFFLSTR